jgi:H+/Cl- antiporter ClcA/CBS domain-containing protein
MTPSTVPEEGRAASVEPRVLFISAISIFVALLAGGVAQLLTRLIGLVTNLAFYGRWSTDFVSPANNHLGALVVVVPVVGGLIVGVMARWGSKAIRGHGIPEAMEQILFNESRIPARLTFLKPLSAAIAIGTGGPFGAEGPIIATGGALGSLLGQVLTITAEERKTLLCAGAAAGMAATFGSPVSAVLLAIELLLFEYRAKSIIPVSLASVTAAAFRGVFSGFAPVFSMPILPPPSSLALASYVALGALVGLAAVGTTRAVYAVEDAFERLPMHWMWWPSIGAVAVGVVGYFSPRTMGVGYDNIDAILSGQMVGTALAVLCVLKFTSWSIALGSGTSGGTLAPLFTVGGAMGSVLGSLLLRVAPDSGVDIRMAALVGMAAMFAGASHATLASVVFAFETTRQPMGLLPLLGGCSAAYLLSCLLMRTSIMTEKIARRGIRVRMDYAVDLLEQVSVADCATREVVVLSGDDTLIEVRQWLVSEEPGASHTGFPVIDEAGKIIGVVTRRDLLDEAHPDDRPLSELLVRPAATIYEDSSVRQAADIMVVQNVGRLPVVARKDPSKVVGIVTRRDLLAADKRRLDGGTRALPTVRMPRLFSNAFGRKSPRSVSL